MFRRHWSGLPPDASFPEKLSDLGYFVNEGDEVRLIADPEYYFKFFLDRNTRINLRQRFEFDNAIEALIHSRLEQRGLERVALPLGAMPPNERHVPIYVSPQLVARSRVVIFLGEPSQELGVLSKRVACGPGGINKDSLVSVVEALGRQASHTADATPPGLVIANPGQLWWWPEGRRALTTIASSAIPLPSLVHYGRRHVPALNAIPGNEDPAGHVRYLWSDVLPALVSANACLSIIAVGESCELVTKFFDDTNNWATWGHRLSSMLLIGTVYSDESLTNTALKDFMVKRTRAYLLSSSPLNTPLASPNGNESKCIPSFGCPSYSSAESYYTELILINALEPALEYIETVATTPGFENPAIVVTAKPEPNEEDLTEDDWTKLSDDCKLTITVAPAV